MAWTDQRAQVLANCKCLYGPDAEIFTLSYGQNSSLHQAVVMKFDSFTASWTKFLHSNPAESAGSTDEAIVSLLRETETELAKLFSANGVSVPFSGDPVQAMALHRRMRSDSGGTSCSRSESSTFEFIATPESTSPEDPVFEETAPYETQTTEWVPEVKIEYAICDSLQPESLAIEEAPCEPCQEIYEDAPTETDCEPGIVVDEVLPTETECEPCRVYEEDPCEPYEEAPPSCESPKEVEEAPPPFESAEEVYEAPSPPGEPCEPCEKACEAVSVPDVPRERLEGVHEEVEPVEDEIDWTSFVGNKGKKEKGKSVTGEPPGVDEPAIPDPGPEAPLDDFGSWGTNKKGKKKKGKGLLEEAVMIEEPLARVPEPEAPIDDWTPWGAPINKKKKGKRVTFDETPMAEEAFDAKPVPDEPQVEVLPPPEPEPEVPQGDDFEWDSFRISKKGQKKKSRAVVEENIVEEAPALEPEPEMEPSSPVGSLRRYFEAISAEGTPKPVQEPEALTDDLIWSFGTKKGKKKKVKSIVEEIPRTEEPIPDPDPPVPAVDEDGSDAFWVSNSKKDKKPPKTLVLQNPSSSEEPPVETFEACPPQEVRETSITAASLPPEVLPYVITRHPRTQVGKTIVLTILHTNKAGNHTLQTMVNLTDNTMTAIFNAVNQHLDSSSEGRYTTSHRNIKIKYGGGKNGDLDLSALEESRWPEYLEYLSRCTKLPELTIEAVDCY